MINALLVEDSAIFAMGLRLALDGHDEVHLQGHVTSPGAAISFLNAHPETQVVIVDISIEQQKDGLTLLSILKEAFPHVSTMVLSHYKTPAYIIQSITYGAKGYIAKDSDPEEIANAIVMAVNGDCFFFGETIPQKEIERIFGGANNLKSRKPQSLTAKEMEVLQLVHVPQFHAAYARILLANITDVGQGKLLLGCLPEYYVLVSLEICLL